MLTNKTEHPCMGADVTMRTQLTQDAFSYGAESSVSTAASSTALSTENGAQATLRKKEGLMEFGLLICEMYDSLKTTNHQSQK